MSNKCAVLSAITARFCFGTIHGGFRIVVIARKEGHLCVSLLLFVGAKRLELSTPCTPCKCASQLRHAPNKLDDFPIGNRLQKYYIFYNRQNFFFFLPNDIPIRMVVKCISVAYNRGATANSKPFGAYHPLLSPNIAAQSSC